MNDPVPELITPESMAMLLIGVLLFFYLCAAEAADGPIVATLYGKVDISSSVMAMQRHLFNFQHNYLLCVLTMRSAGLNSFRYYLSAFFFFQVQGRYSDTAQVIPYCLGYAFLLTSDVTMDTLALASLPDFNYSVVLQSPENWEGRRLYIVPFTAST